MDTCSQADDYVAGRLSPADARAFEAHANTCPTCAKAVTRRRAVELAATVLKRNQQVRGARGEVTQATSAEAKAPEVVQSAAAALAPQQIDVRASAGAIASEEIPLERRSYAPRFAIGVALVLVVGIAIVWSSRAKSPSETNAAASHAPVAETPLSPSAATPDPQPTSAQAVAELPRQVPVAPAATPEAAPMRAPQAVPAPAVTQPAATAPQPSTPPVVAALQSSTPAPGTAMADTKSEVLPLDTDIETLARIVGTRRCAPAIEPLRARVASERSDARSWALLTQCYAKRHRWQNTLDAYDKVVEYGDPALVESVQAMADKARAALAPPSEAAPAPAADTTAAGTPAVAPESAATP